MIEIRIGDRFIYTGRDNRFKTILEVVNIEDPGSFDKIKFKVIENTGQLSLAPIGSPISQYLFQSYLEDNVYQIQSPIVKPSKSRLELIDD